ncbi:MAG: hypothetical protein ACLGG0_14290 [Bacteriovoracia bacterium]
MTNRLKKASTKNHNLGEDLRSPFNTDEWHKLFDILVQYEQDGGSADDEVGRLIQKFIEKQFTRHSFPWKTEADFVIKKMLAVAGSWIFAGKPIPAKDTSNKKTAVNVKGLLSKQDFDDIVSDAFTKLMVSGNYNLTATQAEKFSYIYQVTYSATMDQLRKHKKFNAQLVPDPEVPHKKTA